MNIDQLNRRYLADSLARLPADSQEGHLRRYRMSLEVAKLNVARGVLCDILAHVTQINAKSSGKSEGSTLLPFGAQGAGSGVVSHYVCVNVGRARDGTYIHDPARGDHVTYYAADDTAPLVLAAQDGWAVNVRETAHENLPPELPVSTTDVDKTEAYILRLKSIQSVVDVLFSRLPDIREQFEDIYPPPALSDASGTAPAQG